MNDESERSVEVKVGQIPNSETIRSTNRPMTIPGDSMCEMKDDMHDNQLSLNISSVSSSSSNVKLSLTVYGNDLRIKNPYKLGNVYSFLFINGNPKVILGPQCNILSFNTYSLHVNYPICTNKWNKHSFNIFHIR